MGKIISRAAVAQLSFISLGKIKFDGPEMGAMNRLASLVRVRLPVDQLIYPSDDAPPFSLAPANNAMGAQSASSPQPLLDLSVLGGSASVQDDTITISIDIDANSIVPIEAALPYFSLRVGIDNGDAVKLSVHGLEIKAGVNRVTNTIEIEFSKDPSLPGKMGELVSAFIEKTLITNELIIQGVRLGPSSAESYGTFLIHYLILKVFLIKSTSEYQDLLSLL
jgi:hypothetical protein